MGGVKSEIAYGWAEVFLEVNYYEDGIECFGRHGDEILDGDDEDEEDEE